MNNTMRIIKVFFCSLFLWTAILAVAFTFDIYFSEGDEAFIGMLIQIAVMVGYAAFSIPIGRILTNKLKMSYLSYALSIVAAAIISAICGYVFIDLADIDVLFPDGGFLAGIGLAVMLLFHCGGIASIVVVQLIYALVITIKKRRNNK